MTKESGAVSRSHASHGAEKSSPPVGFDRGELLKLAERCEAAAGPGYALRQALGNYAERVGLLSVGQPLPNYTSSIDAAMTLVPDGMDFGCRRGIDTELGPSKSVCHAWVGEGEGDLVFAETVALSLCAAALRARAA